MRRHCVKLTSGSLSSREQEDDDQVWMHGRAGWGGSGAEAGEIRHKITEPLGLWTTEKCVLLKYKDRWAEDEGQVQRSFLLAALHQGSYKNFLSCHLSLRGRCQQNKTDFAAKRTLRSLP